MKKLNELINKYNLQVVNNGANLKTWKTPSESDLKILRENKQKIISIILEEEEEEQKKIQENNQLRKEELENLGSGKTKIILSWRQGSPLSGYVAEGQGSDLLVGLGLAHYVSGWGTLVDDEVKDELGKEFTYSQAVELTQPKREVEKKKKENAEKEILKKQKEAIVEAKASGKEVTVRQLGGYDGDSDNSAQRKFGDECGYISVSEVATPEGKIEEREIPSF